MPPPPPKPRKQFPLVTALVETFGFSPKLASAFSLFLALLLVAALVWIVRSAPPRTLV
ncbi:MAG: C4-dicarboxylate transporter substrate-binding protein, partial [Verrucomicrobia bacterium]|nr:C4-dicarboxylate transporter substrate-binding protein [Verrucomicrobiota bacterium]